MDKNTLIGFTLIALVLIGFSIYNQPSPEEQARIRHYQDSIQMVAQMQAEAEAVIEEAQRQAQKVDSASMLFAASQGSEQIVTLKNELVELQLSNKGGRVCKATLFNYKGQDEQPIVLFENEDTRLNFAFSGKNENILTEDLYFEPLHASDSTVTMRLHVGEGRFMDFNYLLPSGRYIADLTIQANGLQHFFPANANSMSIDWSQRARQLEKGYSFEQQFSSLTYRIENDDTEHLNERAEDKEEVASVVNWIAFKNQFFSSVMIADQEFTKTILSSSPEKEGSGYLKKYDARMDAFFDPTGKVPTNLQLYYGPNHFKTLQATNKFIKGNEDKDPELENLVYLGWPLMRWINRWFTINVFDWLSGWGLSMGIVLLIMTIIVKIVVFPATYKSFMSSTKMRVLRPYIEEINKKYPKQEDALKKNQETMALYQRYGVSPMGGCLPMLIQMPVFIALFNFVPNAIELRGQSFLWAKDLSTYDDVINWGTDIWLLGDHLSLFCLLFSVTNILNTWYMMRQQDTMGQQQMPGMKIMMYAMPVMFIFFFNSYSAGLNYYYFISGLLGILIMIVLRKTTNEKALLAKMEAKMEANKNKPRKQSGMMAKMEALQKQLEEQQRLQQQQQNKRR